MIRTNSYRFPRASLLLRTTAVALLASSSCADFETGQQGRHISAGADADILDHPWMVTIRKDEHACGGAILNKDWILTAAHCVDDVSIFDINITAGVTNLDDIGTLGQSRNPIGIRRHPKFVRRVTGEYDVALIELGAPLDLSDPAVSAIPRVKPSDDAQLTAKGTPATVIGWGATDEENLESNTLQEVIVSIGTELAQTTSVRQISAGGAGVGSCRGDSGGPLVVIDPQTDTPQLAGVASWNGQCRTGVFATMYARVSSFEKWIDDTMFVPQPWADSFVFTSPSAVDPLSDTIDLTVAADDEETIETVAFLLPDGTTIETTRPFAAQWNTTHMLNGTFSVEARAYDAAGTFLATTAIRIEINNPDSNPDAVVVGDFEDFDGWFTFGFGNIERDRVDSSQPHRGQGAFRFTNTLMTNFGGVYRRFPEPLDLTSFATVRLWAKSLENEGSLSVSLTDVDGEVWGTTTRFPLTDRYQEIRVPLDAAGFERTDGEPANGRPDFDAISTISVVFFDANPRQTDYVTFFLDDVVLDGPVDDGDPADTVLNLDNDHDNWFAFGAGDPSAATSDDALEGTGALAYRNSVMGAFGGLVRAFDTDLLGMLQVAYSAKAEIEAGGSIAIELKEAGGEVWTQRNAVPLELNYTQYSFTLSPAVDFRRSDGAATGNGVIDLDNIVNIHFVFRPALGTSEESFGAVVDNIEFSD